MKQPNWNCSQKQRCPRYTDISNAEVVDLKRPVPAPVALQLRRLRRYLHSSIALAVLISEKSLK
jgi:hypothetical protein